MTNKHSRFGLDLEPDSYGGGEGGHDGQDVKGGRSSQGGFDGADDFGAFDAFDGAFSKSPELEKPIIRQEDEEPIGPQDIAPQTANLIAQEKAKEAMYEQMEPAQRIETLMQQMPTRKKELLKIMAMCTKPTSFQEVASEVEKIQQANATVFDSANLCALLENAGALTRVLQDGSPYPTQTFEPRVVTDENGNETLEPVSPPDVYWHSTKAAADAVALDNPSERLEALLNANAKYLPIYKRVLSMACADGGTSTEELGDAIDKDPLVQKPRFFAMHFTEALEEADAVEWTGERWKATELGKAKLAQLCEDVGGNEGVGGCEEADASGDADACGGASASETAGASEKAGANDDLGSSNEPAANNKLGA